MQVNLSCRLVAIKKISTYFNLNEFMLFEEIQISCSFEFRSSNDRFKLLNMIFILKNYIRSNYIFIFFENLSYFLDRYKIC
jgi:hypothetical protein